MKNIELVMIVAKAISALPIETAFIGGATLELFITDNTAPPLRPTIDVDCVVEVVTKKEYYKLQETLEGIGFKHLLPGEEGPICRMTYSGIKVDFIPADGSVLGFGNRWHAEGLKHAEEFTLPDATKIRGFSLPYLLASKIEAFRDRGNKDFQLSHDIEDVMALIDGASEVIKKITGSPVTVRDYLQKSFSEFLENERFLECIEGHLPGEGRAVRALKIIRALK